MAGTRWAHPRSRGENAVDVRRHDPGAGSSPLTRGKPPGGYACQSVSGLIPAHAGKTSSGNRPPAPPRAHPRSRGENALDVDPTDVDDGSSPLTRGKHGDAADGAPCTRLIPAHAGKTPTAYRGNAANAAHPRSRGENLVQLATRCYTRGSSPLTRGKLKLRTSRPFMTRLIPAHAGKTSSPTSATD